MPLRRVDLAIAAMALSALVAVATAAETRNVSFAKGGHSATLKGTIKGDDTVDYKLRAAAGQTMTVSMTADRPSLYFNVLPPGSSDVALYNSAIDGNTWTGQLQHSGEHTIRVYLYRNEARRNRVANYTLKVGITGAGGGTDARVPGTSFHATGEVPCTMGTDAPKRCPYGVIRSGPGKAEVHITPPGGTTRTLTFAGSQATAPGSQSIKADKQGDEWSIEVNDFERYRIPDAVINGG